VAYGGDEYRGAMYGCSGTVMLTEGDASIDRPMAGPLRPKTTPRSMRIRVDDTETSPSREELKKAADSLARLWRTEQALCNASGSKAEYCASWYRPDRREELSGQLWNKLVD
jgi:hypothetical protein